MAAPNFKVGDDMGAIRIEADGSNDMAQIYSWLSRNRGQVVSLESERGGERQLTLGVPISGARAVIVTAALDNGMAGVLRAVASPAGGAARLAFDVRSKGGLGREAAQEIAVQVVEEISRQMAGEELVARVA
jgi:hypothetical protein